MNAQEINKKVFIARNCARTAGLTVSNLTSNLTHGELVVIDETGTILATAAAAKAAKAIRIIGGTVDGFLNISDIIRAKDVTSYKGTKFAQSTEQRIAIGYNGTSGNIVAADANAYSIFVEHDMGVEVNLGPKDNHVYYISPSSSTTPYMVADGLTKVSANFYAQYPETGLKTHIITSNAGAAGVTGGAVTEGSNIMTYTAGTTPVVGGVYIVPGKTGTPYRDELDTVYTVESINSTTKTVTFTMPYQNASQTGLAVNVIAAPAVGSFGIVFEGKLQSFSVGNGAYVKSHFEVQSTGFGTTPVTDSGSTFQIYNGNGRHEEVSLDEYYHSGAVSGNQYQNREYQKSLNETIVGNGYSGINITYMPNQKININESNGVRKQLVIYTDRTTYADIKTSAAGTAYGTNIITGTGADTVNGDSVVNVLNAFMVGAGVISTGLNSTSNAGFSLAGDGVYSAGIDF